jgi:spore germination protein YaaH
MKKFFGGIVILIIVGAISWLMLNKKELILNPLSAQKTVVKNQDKLKTFGFLPTWMIGKTRVYGKELNNLVFSGIEVDETGNLIWNGQSNKINNEIFLAQKKKISESGGKNIVGIKLFDDEKLDQLLSNKNASQNLINQIKKVVSENNFDGVNLDFEYQKDPTAILGTNFLDFLDKLKLAKVGVISVDVFANTIIRGDEEGLKNLVIETDDLLIMAYDFHRPGVNFAGAVAPIGAEAGDRNITEIVERILNIGLDKKKIIMTYPLYGYEWETYTQDFGSQIERGWYQMSSWNRTKELIKEKNLQVKWDELSMTPWVEFEEDNQIHQIYFENERSLKAKMDLVTQNQLEGYGFWALGYEGEDKSVWY